MIVCARRARVDECEIAAVGVVDALPGMITAIPREGPDELAADIFRALGVQCRDSVVTSGSTRGTERTSP
jgi:hypothetical protein